MNDESTEPRARTVLRGMIDAFDKGDSDAYWGCFSLLLKIHDEMLGRQMTDEGRAVESSSLASVLGSVNPLQSLTDEEYDVAVALDMDAVRSLRTPVHPKYLRDENTGKTHLY